MKLRIGRECARAFGAVHDLIFSDEFRPEKLSFWKVLHPIQSTLFQPFVKFNQQQIQRISFLHLHLRPPALFNPILRGISGVLALCVITSGCSKKLTTVLVEDPSGNVELIYAGTQTPENLVKEIRYFSNGDTLSITPMLKSAIHGVFTAYHQGNLKKEEVTFQKGIQDGIFRKYDKEGILVFEGGMSKGLKNGVWTTWYDEVQMAEQRVYVNDQADGVWTYWFIDGSPKREEIYKLGKLIEHKNFN